MEFSKYFIHNIGTLKYRKKKMWSARGIIILLVLLSIHSLNVFAQADCQACLQVDASLSPCNTSLKRPNPGETVIVQFGGKHLNNFYKF